MSYDIIIIGGNFAGLAAALQIARARRRVLLVDSGRPRNRFAAASHGFLGQDGKSPGEIQATALAQLLAYPTVTYLEAEARSARSVDEGFVIVLGNEAAYTGSRLILATGVTDELADIPGLKERWGQSVLHCPYCHGYEVSGQRLGVLATGPMSFHQAMLIPDWGPTTLFTNGVFEPDAEQLAQLQVRGVIIENTPVRSLSGEGSRLEAVQLADGRSVAIDALFTGSRLHPSSPLAEQLGCAYEEGPMGSYLKVDKMQQTSVPGVFAAGDATRMMHNATFAAADGVMAGISAHRSLIFGL